MSENVERIVLDTNVCLDLFVFDDPRCARLHDALHAGEVMALTDEACRDEWLGVLQYPQLRMDEAARATATARFDAAIRLWSPPCAGGSPPAALPRCRDPDDQKFLALAATAQARWLLTRDEHLLALARRTRRQGLFGIVTPMEWSRS